MGLDRWSTRTVMYIVVLTRMENAQVLAYVNSGLQERYIEGIGETIDPKVTVFYSHCPTKSSRQGSKVTMWSMDKLKFWCRMVNSTKEIVNKLWGTLQEFITTRTEITTMVNGWTIVGLEEAVFSLREDRSFRASLLKIMRKDPLSLKINGVTSFRLIVMSQSPLRVNVRLGNRAKIRQFKKIINNQRKKEALWIANCTSKYLTFLICL